MYLPKHFEETDRARIVDVVRRYPLATLVLGSSEGLTVNHIPFYLDLDSGESGVLLGHIPRANPLSEVKGPADALAIFHGPNSYISPSWYPTKKESGKVVPTWDYQVVHLHGRLRIIDDPKWVLAQIELLTNENEKAFEEPWRVTDAPQEFTSRLIKMLVGIEIVITDVIAKSKVSQNQPEENRAGVAAGLRKSTRTTDKEMAELVEKAKPDDRH